MSFETMEHLESHNQIAGMNSLSNLPLPTANKPSAVGWFTTAPQPLGNPEMVRDLMNNEKFWIDKHGQAHLIELMSVRYKLNVLNYLQRHAAPIFQVYRMGAPSADLFLGWHEQAWLITRPLVAVMRDQVVHNIGGEDV